DDFPRFRDLFGRVDYHIGRSHVLTMSGVDQRDASLTQGFGLRGADAGAVWGDRAARATLAGRLGSWRVTHTLGVADHRFDSRPGTRFLPQIVPDSTGALITLAPLALETRGAEVRVRHLAAGGEIAPA